MTDPLPAPDETFHPVFDYDECVPADLLTRWTSLNQDRAVLLDLAGFLVTAGGLLLTGIGLVGLATGGLAVSVGVALCLIGQLSAIVTAVMRRRWLRRNHIRGRDIDLILTHRTGRSDSSTGTSSSSTVSRSTAGPKRRKSRAGRNRRSAQSRPPRCGRTQTFWTTDCGSIWRRTPGGSR